MSNEYKMTTILDIMALEEDQIDRLCAELPSMLKQVKALTVLLEVAGDVAGVEKAFELITPLTWIDDGKADLTVKAICGEEEVFEYKSTH